MKASAFLRQHVAADVTSCWLEHVAGQATGDICTFLSGGAPIHKFWLILITNVYLFDNTLVKLRATWQVRGGNILLEHLVL